MNNNDIDGYNYKRHEDYLTPGPDYDKDDIVSTWMGNDDFCMVHSGYLLDIYERDQGGKDDNGRPTLQRTIPAISVGIMILTT